MPLPSFNTNFHYHRIWDSSEKAEEVHQCLRQLQHLHCGCMPPQGVADIVAGTIGVPTVEASSWWTICGLAA